MPQLIGLKQSDTEARLRQQWATNSFFRPETADRIRQLLRTQITNLLNEDMQWMENQGLLRLTTPVMVQRNGNGLREVYSENLPLDDIRKQLQTEATPLSKHSE